MATRLFQVSPGQTEFQIVDVAGSPTVSAVIELTVDLNNTLINGQNGTTRQIKKSEVLLALSQLENYILKDTSGNFI